VITILFSDEELVFVTPEQESIRDIIKLVVNDSIWRIETIFSRLHSEKKEMGEFKKLKYGSIKKVIKVIFCTFSV
jgi:hypothetical protein